ncbi:hypothetical protein Bbelb_300460 [Branchiostoma belcheri]|nr:hypothetical protein Bbelb_300460 [Branchiostoma belcheri]
MLLITQIGLLVLIVSPREYARPELKGATQTRSRRSDSGYNYLLPLTERIALSPRPVIEPGAIIPAMADVWKRVDVGKVGFQTDLRDGANGGSVMKFSQDLPNSDSA